MTLIVTQAGRIIPVQTLTPGRMVEVELATPDERAPAEARRMSPLVRRIVIGLLVADVVVGGQWVYLHRDSVTQVGSVEGTR